MGKTIPAVGFHAKVMCKDCQRETWHNILHKLSNGWSDEKTGFWEDKTFFTLQCKGCDNVCLLIEYYFSEDIDSKTGAPELRTSIHPSPYKNDKELIDGLFHVPEIVKVAYDETIRAFNSGLMILTAIGIRTVIEAVAINQKIKIQGIESKIKQMVNHKLITPSGAELLRLVKDIGNLATHEIRKQHRDDISLCIEVVNDVLRSLYIHPKEASMARNVAEGKWKRVG